VSWEVAQGDIYLHVDVFKWTHGVYKQMLVTLEGMKELARDEGLDRLRVASPNRDKVRKFISMLGFVLVGESDKYCIFEQVI